MAWSYNREESSFKPIPEGRHRIRINSVEKVTAKTGREMLAFKFDVSGYSSMIFHNIVFMEDRPQLTNRLLTQFFDAFPGIPDGDFNVNNWVGKVGAAQVKHEEYNGDTNARIHYFLKPDKAESLPPWIEPQRETEGSSAPARPIETDADGFMKVEDGDLPDGLF